jgi:hypothetical protein
VDVAVVGGGAPNGIKNKEIEKRRKYPMDCANNDVLFDPFVLDSFGRIGSCDVKILRKLSGSCRINMQKGLISRLGQLFGD